MTWRCYTEPQHVTWVVGSTVIDAQAEVHDIGHEQLLRDRDVQHTGDEIKTIGETRSVTMRGAGGGLAEPGIGASNRS